MDETDKITGIEFIGDAETKKLFGTLVGLAKFIENPTREALLGGQSVEDALDKGLPINGRDNLSDRRFMERVLALSVTEPALIREIVTARCHLNNGIKLSNFQASLLLEELRCPGFDQVDLNVRGYTFGNVYMSFARVGGDLLMGNVKVGRNLLQEGMQVGGDLEQEGMQVGGRPFSLAKNNEAPLA